MGWVGPCRGHTLRWCGRIEGGDIVGVRSMNGMDPRDHTSPDGTLRVEFDRFEPKMSHWVYRPRITDTRTGRVLVDLWGTPWDGGVEFEQEGHVLLRLWRYPGRMPPLTVHVSLREGLFFFDESPAQREPLAVLTKRLEAWHREREREYAEAHQVEIVPSWSARLRRPLAWAQALLFVMLGLAFVCGGGWWVLSGEGGIEGWLVLVGASAGLAFAIGDVRKLLDEGKEP